MEKLERCGLGYVQFALSRPAHFRVMFRPELTGKADREAIDHAATQSFAVLLRVVSRAHAEGLATDLDAEALALTGWSTAHGLASLCLDGPLAAKGNPRGLAETVGATLAALLVRGPAKASPKRAARRQ